MCFVFVWRDKQDRIKRNTAQNHVKHGGLGVPNLNIFIKSLKLNWIRKYSQSNHKWKSIASEAIPFLNKLEYYGPNIVATYKNKNMF